MELFSCTPTCFLQIYYPGWHEKSQVQVEQLRLSTPRLYGPQARLFAHI